MDRLQCAGRSVQCVYRKFLIFFYYFELQSIILERGGGGFFNKLKPILYNLLHRNLFVPIFITNTKKTPITIYLVIVNVNNFPYITGNP